MRIIYLVICAVILFLSLTALLMPAPPTPVGSCGYCNESYVCQRHDTNEFNWFALVAAVVSALAGWHALYLVCEAITSLNEIKTVIPEKIRFLMKNNDKIEGKLKSAIESAQAHEKGTYEALKPDADVTVAVALYPVLASNELVAGLLKVYQQNNAEIKTLQLSLIEGPKFAFQLYFGSYAAEAVKA